MAEQELKHFIRVANTDLEGKKPVMYALAKIDGIGYNLASAICKLGQIDVNKKAGYLTEQEVSKLDEAIKSLKKVPSWMYDRKKEPVTGKDTHLITAQLKLARENDVKIMKKIKSFKGMRHSIGQPVRGQRTRSHFRKGTAVGVQRAKIKQAPAAEKGKKKN